MRRIRWSRIVLPIVGGGLVLLCWYLWGAGLAAAKQAQGLDPESADVIRRILLPYPGEVFTAAIEERALILGGTRSTFFAAGLGFMAAVFGGYAIALGLSLSAVFKQIFHPWILVLQMTPVVIIAPIVAIWLSEPAIAPVVIVTFLIGFFPVVANATLGLVSVEKNLRELFAVSRASRLQELIYLRIPYSMPSFLTGTKVAATLAPIGAITGDIFVGSAEGEPGMGYLVLLYKQTANTPALFATAIMACLIGFIFVGFVHIIHWAALRSWHESMVRADR